MDKKTEEIKEVESQKEVKRVPGDRLRELELGKQLFVLGNGNQYFIEPHVSAARFKEMQLLEVDLGFDMDYKKISERLGEAYEHLNNQNFADAAVEIRNIMDGVAMTENKHMPIMRYCAMFLNRAGEDRRIVDELVVDAKIKDWEDEGITYHSFFLLAINMVRGLKESYEKHTLDTSQE